MKTVELILEVFNKVGNKKNFIIFFLCALIILTAHWFIAIFLFDRNFFNHHQVWLTILISFVVSFNWLFLTIYFGERDTKLIQEILLKRRGILNDNSKDKLKELNDSNSLFYRGGIVAIMSLSGMIGIVKFFFSYFVTDSFAAFFRAKEFIFISFAMLFLINYASTIILITIKQFIKKPKVNSA